MRQLLVVGGAGFIGREFLRQVIHNDSCGFSSVRVIDKLTYASNVKELEEITGDGIEVEVTDVADLDALSRVFGHPAVIVNFAAESHVDNSIRNPAPFAMSNYVGVSNLLDLAVRSDVERFVQVSTDEVYGSLLSGEASENSALNPSSPYSASKASSDLLALAFEETYGLNVTITRTCNNFGPGQHSEKLIPKALQCVKAGKAVPVYGTGKHQREWIDVRDNAKALVEILRKESFAGIVNIGSGNRFTNLEVLDKLFTVAGEGEIEYVSDRLGHDLRYALDSSHFAETFGAREFRSLDEYFEEVFG